jgi:hypothetical protein
MPRLPPAEDLEVAESGTVVPVSVFYLLVLALCVTRPGAGRIFVGIFFLVLATGVNALLIAPDQFLGPDTDLPL